MQTSKKLGTMKEALLNLSDTHCGSEYGLMPPAGSVELFDKSFNSQNPLQKIMWDVWTDHCKKSLAILKGKKWHLILNGDLVEGVHHKNTEALANVENHKRIAIFCLKPLAKAAIKSGGSVIVIEGTECHTNRDEEGIAKELGAVTHNDSKKRYTFDGVDVEINGVLMNFTHHMPPSMRPWTELNGLGLHLNDAIMQRLRAGQPCPIVWGWAHRHRKGYVCTGDHLGLCNGAYQFKTRHANKVVPNAVVCPTQTILEFSGYGLLPYIRQIGTNITQHQRITL